MSYFAAQRIQSVAWGSVNLSKDHHTKTEEERYVLHDSLT